MRLGGPVLRSFSDPDEWISLVKQYGYRAAYCPLNGTQEENLCRAFREAAEKSDIVIAEVGAWSNPISPVEDIRRKAIQNCKEQLALAERIGARCCVNIAGARGNQWDGPYPDNLTRDTFDLIVETVREIIDEVSPHHTFYTLETMPWAFPDSVDSYVDLIKAVDRKQFAVHLDPVNLISSPQRFFGNSELLRECFKKLGPYIKSCHAKDIALSGKLTVHLDEVVVGRGGMDYRTFLQELNKLDPDIPILLEHLSTESEYLEAAGHIRKMAQNLMIEV